MSNILNIKIRTFPILISVLLIGSCCFDNPLESDLDLNYNLSEKVIENINLTPGTRVDSVKLKDGKMWKFGISVPENINDSEIPFVLALHWSTEGGINEYEPYFRCQAVPGLEKLNAIIFAPDAGDFNFWDEENYSLIITFIDYAKKYWPIDENKIVVTGYSNGGYGTWFFGTQYHYLFSAAIPVASRIEYKNISIIPQTKLKIPFYVIHSKNDGKFDFQEIEKKVNDLNKLGSDIQLHVAEGLTHNSACAYYLYLDSAVNWLVNEVWR